jgi:hypothetical protein
MTDRCGELFFLPRHGFGRACRFSSEYRRCVQLLEEETDYPDLSDRRMKLEPAFLLFMDPIPINLISMADLFDRDFRTF